jgi:hypothetical protein
MQICVSPILWVEVLLIWRSLNHHLLESVVEIFHITNCIMVIVWGWLKLDVIMWGPCFPDFATKQRRASKWPMTETLDFANRSSQLPLKSNSKVDPGLQTGTDTKGGCRCCRLPTGKSEQFVGNQKNLLHSYWSISQKSLH